MFQFLFWISEVLWGQLTSTSFSLIQEARRSSSRCTWFNNLCSSIALPRPLSSGKKMASYFYSVPHVHFWLLLLWSHPQSATATSLMVPQFCFSPCLITTGFFIFIFCQLSPLELNKYKTKTHSSYGDIGTHPTCIYLLALWHLAQVTLVVSKFVSLCVKIEMIMFT